MIQKSHKSEELKTKSSQDQHKTHSRYNLPVIISVSIVLVSLAVGLGFALNRRTANVLEITDLVEEYITDRTNIDWSGYSAYRIELADSLTLTNAGIYYISGEIAGGNITINTEENIKLVLDGVKITSSRGPAIFVQNAKNVVIHLVGENYLKDSANYSGYAEDEVGAIFSHDDLMFDGTGKLIVESVKEDAIVSKDDLKFYDGIYEITAADDAIRGKDSVKIESGNYTINAVADGIKSTNTADEGKGTVQIADGELTLKVGDDGVHAASDLVIDGGKISITESYEGLEGNTVTINAGEINITASDDGINAAGGKDSSGFNRPGFDPFTERTGTAKPSNPSVDSSSVYIEINGGDITVSATGDGVDSNGNIYMNGGRLTVYGPSNSENGALDYDGEFVVTDGTIIAGGASGMAQGISSSSNVYSVNIFFTSNVAQGDTVSIVDESGKTLITYQSDKSFGMLVVASPSFQQGATYTIRVKNEIYQSFTISSATTQVGNGSASGGMPGQGMGGKFGNGNAAPDGTDMPKGGGSRGRF